MKFRFITLAGLLAISAPLSAQSTGGPYSIVDVQTPGVASDMLGVHIALNGGTPGAHQLYYNQFTDAFLFLTNWIPLDMQNASGPAVAVAADGLHFFVIDASGALMHRRGSRGGRFGGLLPNTLSEWTRLGKDFKGSPAAAVYGGKVWVFARTTDNKLVYANGTGDAFGSITAIPEAHVDCSPRATADRVTLWVTGCSNQWAHFARYTNGVWDKWFYVMPGGMNSPENSSFDTTTYVTGPVSIIPDSTGGMVPGQNVFGVHQWKRAAISSGHIQRYEWRWNFSGETAFSDLPAYVGAPVLTTLPLLQKGALIVRGTDNNLYIQTFSLGDVYSSSAKGPWVKMVKPF